MRRLLWVVAVVVVPLASVFAAPDAGFAKAKVVSIPIGQVKAVPAPGFDRVVLDDPTLAAVNPKGDRELLVTGLKDGATTLWIYRKEGNPTAVQLKVGTGRAPEEAIAGDDDGGVTAVWAKPVALKVGAEMLVRTSPLEGLAVVDPEIAEARVLSDGLVVIRGLSPGSTHALVYPRGGKMPTRYPVTVSGPPGDPDGGL